MKTFVTLFSINNIHLTKELGLICYGMHKYYSYDSYVATYDNGPLPNLNIVKGLKIKYIKKIFGNFIFDSFLFLFFNSKWIDVLNVYHMSLHSAIYILIYKFINKKGKVYNKFDGGYAPQHFRPWTKIFLKICFKKCDLVSCEYELRTQSIKKTWGDKIQNLVTIPNPYNDNEAFIFNDYAHRNNIILTVSRIGNESKATDILLKAWSIVGEKYNDWTLQLVGPSDDQEDCFVDFLNKWKKDNYNLLKRTIFFGNVADRDKLFSMFNSSKIFAFPSRHEGFSIAAVEAITSGCTFVGTNIPTFSAVTENYKYGYKFNTDNYEELAKQLVYCIEHMEECQRKAKALFDIAIKKYSLKNVTKLVYEGLNETNS